MKENTKQFWCYMKRLGNGENGDEDLLVNNHVMVKGRLNHSAIYLQAYSQHKVMQMYHQWELATLGTFQN